MTIGTGTGGNGKPIASTTSVLRVMNERAVYERIRLDGPISRPEVAQATGLSKPTVSLALADLERTGLVRTVGHRTGNAGRAAMLYEIHPTAGRVIGIDVGREWVRAAMSGLDGKPVVRRDVRSQARSASALIDQLAGLVDELSAEAGIAPGEVTYIVLGTPGVHDAENNRLLLAPNLPGWQRPGVTLELAERLPAPCLIENDISLAALGEQAHGLGAEVDNFVFLSIGTGIGMGIVLDGRLYRGARGAAGEVAFLPVGETDPLTRSPEAKRHGMLESVLSAAGLVATASRFGMPGRLTVKKVYDAARAGDPIALEAVQYEAGNISRALASVIALLDPQLIVIGGGLGRHGVDVLLDAVRERLADMTPLDPPPIRPSALAEEATVVGALAVGLATALDIVFNRAVAEPAVG
ncbi:ROK family transcriptional regulator [Actinomadura barringtoniae]|uniref:ROK family transcriptional regulator n=1 Tax=Actinomadura barringtoniae TaxID=1427535 RepID=A0A939PM86_9ACTN|nr:ROK family transcriptional regulator [Actinomadura barringtoniae]MBO2454895.1 ROK family transcriptional regulator [Actinomadura barringtoniae]